MPVAEKISIALPPEMLHIVRSAVNAGEYASNSEVVRDALRDWSHKRNLLADLRNTWREALDVPSSDAPPDEVLDRLERKYQSLAS